jgi:hypothetical protein
MQIFAPLLTSDQRSTWRLPFVRVVDGFVDDAFCQRLLARISALGPSAAPVMTRTGAVMRQDIRNNEPRDVRRRGARACAVREGALGAS